MNKQDILTQRKNPEIINNDLDFEELTNEIREASCKSEKSNENLIEVDENLILERYGLNLEIRQCIDAPKGEKNTLIKIKSLNYDSYVECKPSQIQNIFNSLADIGCLISDEQNQRWIIKQIEKRMQENDYTFTHKKIGWGTYKNKKIIKLTNIETCEEKIDSEYIGNVKMSKKGNIEGFKKGVENLIIGNPRLELSLISGICGLIIQELGEEDTNIVINFYGESSSGKSQTTKIPLMLFGQPSELAKTFNSTENRVEKEMTEYQIIPAIIDDKLIGINNENTKRKASLIVEDIFRYSTGHVKGRYNDKDSFNKYYCPIISSTEESIMDLIKDVSTKGQYYRIFEIYSKRGELTKSVEHSRNLGNFLNSNYGHGGEAFAKWLMENKIYGDTLKEMYLKLRDEITNKLEEGYADRMANRLAVIMLSGELLNKCFRFNINLDEIQNLLFDSVRRAFDIANEKDKHLKDLIKYVKKHRECFVDCKNDCKVGKHLGQYRKNKHGNYELAIPSKAFSYILTGSDPKDYFKYESSIEKGEKFETSNRIEPIKQSDLRNLLRYWKNKGILLSGRISGKTTTLTKQETLFKDYKQGNVYIIQFELEE